jgi:molecular chaperone DnaK
MGYQLGIDLGTTYTAAAVCRSSDRGWVEPEVVSLGSRSATVASVLFLAPDGSVLVGEAAERRALTDPDRVVREFKRRVGDPTPIVVAGRNWAPEELSARLVRWVVDRVAEREGGPADRIAITHPASWGTHKTGLLARALASQGLAVTFLAEPQAAALHYASTERVGVGTTIAVYDLGGGTFDAAVVRKGDAASAGSGPAGFGLLGRPEGLERLGGIDFDEVVFEHVRAGLPEAFENLDDTDPAVLSAVARIRRDCTEAKEALSADTEVSIPVLLPASRGSVRLHRSEFEQLIRPQIEETVDALRKAVGSAGLAPEQLTAVLLVGGSSRIPLVSQLVSEQLGRPVAVDADPKNAIAKGAALALSPKPSVTWPGAAIPPVAATGGHAPGVARGASAAGAGAGMAAAAMAAGGLAAPPSRPPLPGGRPLDSGPPSSAPPGTRPPFPSPASGEPRPSVIPAQASAPPRIPPRPPAGPVHESANTLYSGGTPRSEQSWARPQEREEAPGWDDGPDWDDPPPRRPLGLYVGAAGLAAVALIVVVLLWWPDSSPGLGVNTGNSTGTETTTEDAPATSDSVVRPNLPAPTVAPATPTPGAGTKTTKPGNANQGGSSRTTTTRPPEPSTSEEPPPPVESSVSVEPPAADPPVVNPPAVDPAPGDTTVQGQAPAGQPDAGDAVSPTETPVLAHAEGTPELPVARV